MSGTTVATATDMQAVTDRLTAAGLEARLETACCTRYVIATVPAGGDHAASIEVIVDDDGYVELTWWNQPQAAPAQITAVIARAVTAITGDTDPPGPRP